MGEEAAANPQNFDYWDVLINQGEYVDPRFLSPDGVRDVEGYATDVITDLSMDWVESLEGDEPWCVLIWHKAPHRPWEPDEKHQDMYAGSDPGARHVLGRLQRRARHPLGARSCASPTT